MQLPSAATKEAGIGWKQLQVEALGLKSWCSGGWGVHKDLGMCACVTWKAIWGVSRKSPQKRKLVCYCCLRTPDVAEEKELETRLPILAFPILMKSVAVSREKVIHYFQNMLMSNVFSFFK